jgi:DNA polymerase
MMNEVMQVDVAVQEQKLYTLYEQIEADTHLPLYSERLENDYHVVLGEGKPGARIMFVVQSPSSRDAVFGRPFIAAQGHLFHDVLKMTRIERRHIYLTNLVKDTTPHGRPPTHAEITAYAHYLEQEIEILQPLLIIPMGRLTTDYILQYFQATPKSIYTHNAHGQVFEGYGSYGTIKIVPIMNPSSALFNSHSLRTFYLDMQVIRKVAQEAWLLD